MVECDAKNDQISPREAPKKKKTINDSLQLLTIYALLINIQECQERSARHNMPKKVTFRIMPHGA